ncbi:MAG: sodium:alanine symporter family protein [Oscillospiraceae bacterium]|nr:sodium:alanine symporter family protein [Oscillospiraceae bacterium]
MGGDIAEKLAEYLWAFPMPVLLAAAGLWCALQFRLEPYRHPVRTLRETFGSSFGAVCTALSGTVGTGNIVGVALAIELGGPGALFWMWVSALLGMGARYGEVWLSVRSAGDGTGGPMHYMKRGLGRPGMGALFACTGALAAFGIGNGVQIGSMASVLETLPPWVPGIAAAGALLLLGSRRGRALEWLMPIMAGGYIICCVLVIGANLQEIPRVLGDIMQGALSPAALGWGFRRGIISSEAGLGSAPIAHAVSGTGDPDREALAGVGEVAVDTLLISTLTGLMLLTSGAPAGGPAWAARAAGTVLGELGGPFIALCLCLFAFTSVLSWALYGEECAAFLLGARARAVYRVIFAAFAVFGGLFPLDGALAVSDILNASMALVNTASLFMYRKAPPTG